MGSTLKSCCTCVALDSAGYRQGVFFPRGQDTVRDLRPLLAHDGENTVWAPKTLSSFATWACSLIRPPGHGMAWRLRLATFSGGKTADETHEWIASRLVDGGRAGQEPDRAVLARSVLDPAAVFLIADIGGVFMHANADPIPDDAIEAARHNAALPTAAPMDPPPPNTTACMPCSMSETGIQIAPSLGLPRSRTSRHAGMFGTVKHADTRRSLNWAVRDRPLSGLAGSGTYRGAQRRRAR
jgi:hypothetical protein